MEPMEYNNDKKMNIDTAVTAENNDDRLLEQMIHETKEIKELLHSFVAAMATAIDQRTPYNGNHTRNVTKYAGEFADYLNVMHDQGKFDECFDTNRKEQLILAAGLHDIGKMIIPLSVMNKSTRLGNELESILQRYELITCYIRLDAAEGKISKEECKEKCADLKQSADFIEKVNQMAALTEETEEQIRILSKHQYEKKNGEILHYLTEEETDCLLVQKGTLTEEERKIMESHVAMTSKILSNIHWNTQYSNVPIWAGAHHEFLDGSGYPNHLTEEEMPLEVRILSLADIYDALIAADRPYKSPMPIEEALQILKSMAEDGKLDKTLVAFYADFISRCQSEN